MTACDKIPDKQQKLRYDEKKRLAEEIYEARIRHLIAPEDEDKYVKIDVLTGEYEIHENSATAGRKLRTRCPNAVIHTMHRHKTHVIRLRGPIRQVKAT
jgi:hypothetical protein